MKRKAFYYSIDALLAAIILFTFIQISLNHSPPQEIPKNYLEESYLSAISSISMKAIYNSSPTAKVVIDSGLITSENISVLEAVGELWAINQSSLSRDLLSDINKELNLSIVVSIDNETIYGSHIDNPELVLFSSRIISGISKNKPLEGVSSSASLLKINNKTFYSYAYLGGFIGQGNISVLLQLPSWLNDSFINSFSAYIDLGGDFSLYVNNHSCMNISPTYDLMIPETFDLSLCKSFLHNGTNYLQLYTNSPINESFITGGYFRVGYVSDNLIDKPPLSYSIHDIPGVEGIINIYDGIPIDGTLRNMSFSITINNSAETILVIGSNKWIFNSTNNETKTFILSDQNLSILNYSSISNSTIPIRIYSKDVLPKLVDGGNADVVLITDVSGSMDWRMDSDDTGIQRGCDDPLLYDNSTQRLSLAKCLDKDFVDMILNYTGNRVALVSFNEDASGISLTDDKDYLHYVIDQYSPDGGTCICCALNYAYNILNSESNSSRKKYVILMTDGIPTHRCARSSCYGTLTYGYWSWWSGCYGNSNDCVGDDCDCPRTNANWSSCRIHNDLYAKVYSIGFGNLDSCENARTTLQGIADCGNGSMYISSDPNVLKNIYHDLALEIINLSYKAQLVMIEGDFVPAHLFNASINFSIDKDTQYPASSIDFIYEEPLNDCNNTIFIPDLSIIDAYITSFSGPHWTKLVVVNNNTILNLSEYRFSFVELGDPFLIAIPPSMLFTNSNNSITIIPGDSMVNDSECMKNNSLILHVAVPSTTTRSVPMPVIEGCNWSIYVYTKGVEQLIVPSTYTGDRHCSYTPTNVSFNGNNAYDVAVYDLLKSLDPMNINQVLVSFDNEDLQIVINAISGIPYMWGPALLRIEREIR